MRDKIIEKVKYFLEKHKVQFHYDSLNVPDWKKSHDYIDLVDLLKQEKKLKIFDEKLQMIGNSGSRVQINNLADWIITRSSMNTPEETIENLYQYVTSKEFEAQAILLLTGIHLENEFTITDEISVVKPHSINKLSLQLSLSNNERSYLPLPKIEAIVKKTVKQKVLHINDSDEHKLVTDNETFETMNDVRLVFSLLSGNRGPQALAFSIIAEDDTPVLFGGSWSICSFRNTIINPPIIEFEANNVKQIYSFFLQSSEDVQKQMRIVLRSLSNYNCTIDIVQKSIDLRICMESLFLDDGNKQELRFRLSLRAALFETTLELKDTVSKDFKKAYDITSTAVHTGKLSNKKITEAQELYPTILEKMKRVIVYILKNGAIDWNKSELSGELIVK